MRLAVENRDNPERNFSKFTRLFEGDLVKNGKHRKALETSMETGRQIRDISLMGQQKAQDMKARFLGDDHGLHRYIADTLRAEHSTQTKTGSALDRDDRTRLAAAGRVLGKKEIPSGNELASVADTLSNVYRKDGHVDPEKLATLGAAETLSRSVVQMRMSQRQSKGQSLVVD